MRHIAYRFLAAISAASVRVGAGALARPRLRSDSRTGCPSRPQLGTCLRSRQLWIRQRLLCAALMTLTSMIAFTNATGETRPHYGGTLRVMMQSAPNALDLPSNATPADYWDAAGILSLIGDTLVKLDAQSRPQPALAVAWQGDPSARHWQLTLRRGVKFSDGTAASPAAIVQILGAVHPKWNVRASSDSVSIDSETPMPSLLAELALPRNLVLKRNGNGNDNRVPIGTGPFLVAEWQPGKRLKLAANEESWAGRPFVDGVEIEFGKSLHDQALALELDKADVIEVAPQATNGSQRHGTSASLSLPVELLALVFSPNSKAQDPRLREALALAMERKPIQSVLLKGAGEPAASILPNWMTGYSAVFSAAGQSATCPDSARRLAPTRAQSQLRSQGSASPTHRRAHRARRAPSWHHRPSIIVGSGGPTPGARNATESRSSHGARRSRAATGIAGARIPGGTPWQLSRRSVSSRAQLARWIRGHPAFSFGGGECGKCARARLGTGSTAGVERSGAFAGRSLVG